MNLGTIFSPPPRPRVRDRAAHLGPEGPEYLLAFRRSCRIHRIGIPSRVVPIAAVDAASAAIAARQTANRIETVQSRETHRGCERAQIQFERFWTRTDTDAGT